MTFRAAEEYLLGLELFGMNFGLERMHRLMTVLGLPQRRFASIHVVGTNGKSSTVRMIAAILERHGLRTGSYTSPHLESFRERIEVEERPIGEHEFAAAVARAAEAAEIVDRGAHEDDRVTQFEALTAAAYHELGRRGVEVAVIEAGLGGRFDATNVLPSSVQVLTGVGLEHTRWLGPTLTAIAEEKLAVVRDHGRLVVGRLEDEVEAVAERVAEARHAELIHARTDPGVELRAAGTFQRRNFALAMAAAEAFLGRPLDESAVARAAAETGVRGRLELVSDRPLTIYDSAHNPDGARALAEALPEVTGERSPRVAVVSILQDKDAAALLGELLPSFEHVVLTRCANPRALATAELEALVRTPGGPAAESVEEPRAALERARELAGAGGAVLVTGSIYLIAELVRAPARARASTL